MCCIQVVWANYVDAMKQAGFSAGQGLYIASGLLTYGANDGAPPPSTNPLHRFVADACSGCSCCFPPCRDGPPRGNLEAVRPLQDGALQGALPAAGRDRG